MWKLQRRKEDDILNFYYSLSLLETVNVLTCSTVLAAKRTLNRHVVHTQYMVVMLLYFWRYKASLEQNTIHLSETFILII